MMSSPAPVLLASATVRWLGEEKGKEKGEPMYGVGNGYRVVYFWPALITTASTLPLPHTPLCLSPLPLCFPLFCFLDLCFYCFPVLLLTRSVL